MWLRPECVVLFESKLTQREEGYDQLELLYGPLAERALGLPTLKILVCKNLVECPDEQLIEDPIELALAVAERPELLNTTWTWHYDGRAF